MIRRVRLLVVMARPAVLLLLGLFAATGYAKAGGTGRLPLVEALLVVLLAQLSMRQAGWPAPLATAMIAGLAAVVAGQARSMLHCGPTSRGPVPAGPAVQAAAAS